MEKIEIFNFELSLFDTFDSEFESKDETTNYYKI